MSYDVTITVRDVDPSDDISYKPEEQAIQYALEEVCTGGDWPNADDDITIVVKESDD